MLTDDIAYDDIECSSEELKEHIQNIVDTYNLAPNQLLAAISVALEEVVPDERLYAAIDSISTTVSE